MHYFRFMRNSTYEKIQKRNITTFYTPNGYRQIYLPNHPMSSKGGFAFEHRSIFYDHNADKELFCEFCGTDWLFRPYYDHVDHIDEDKLNNDIKNLRPLCNACNTGRGKKECHLRSNTLTISYNNLVMTPEEWSRESISSVCGHTISRRIKSGWSEQDAITKPSKTYKRKMPV